jgi:alpha-tubulin suppressor-like RCC1 family protein
MAAIKNDGTLWTWGYNVGGRLGDGSTTGRSSPQTVAGGGTNWDHISCGYFHMAGIKTDGSLWTWGINQTGQLATGDTTGRSSPGQVRGGMTDWTQVSAGGGTNGSGTGFGNTLAIAVFIGG